MLTIGRPAADRSGARPYQLMMNGIGGPSLELGSSTNSETHFSSHSIIAFSARSLKELTATAKMIKSPIITS